MFEKNSTEKYEQNILFQGRPLGYKELPEIGMIRYLRFVCRFIEIVPRNNFRGKNHLERTHTHKIKDGQIDK
jgi:hypothetical protein